MLRSSIGFGDVKVKMNSTDEKAAYQGTAYEATFDPTDSSIALSGWPQITGNGRQHRAADSSTRMVLFINSPRMVTQGRASTKIIGSQDIDPIKPKAPLALPVR